MVRVGKSMIKHLRRSSKSLRKRKSLGCSIGDQFTGRLTCTIFSYCGADPSACRRKKYTVFAFVEDVAASGGYWIAVAADEIFVDANSIVGSIGVISAGFGLYDLIARYGV